MSRTRQLRSALAVFAACVGLGTVGAGNVAGDESIDASAERPRIVNGINTHGYPTTGALLVGTNAGNAQLQCSGTLIGCRTFLVASHCIIDDSNAAHYFVYLQHAGVFSVARVVPHDDYRDETFPIADVAVLELGSQVTGINPTEINLDDPEPFIPHAGVIVGFGQTLGGANDYGIKRAGAVETRTCIASSIPSGAGDDEVVCWSYAPPIGPPGTDSNTCNGDSGGPLFMDLGSGDVVAGVTSGGSSATCGVGDHSYDANVFTYRAFILDRLGVDSTVACGPLPEVGDADVSVTGNEGALTSGNPSDTYSVTLTEPANLLRFGLNGEDNGILDVDFYVRRGQPASTTTFDCKVDGPGNFGGCEFELPALDTYHVLVQRSAGQGDYQLTTTIFEGPVPECGNGAVETGEQCDGAADAACDGLCNNLACTCPLPSCGNGVTEQGEECDGGSDGACAAGCAGDCACAAVCGDETCDPSETAFGCPEDCGCSSAGACAFGDAPSECFCDALCRSYDDCCPDACSVCGVCTAGCGNGVLEIGEQCDDGNNLPGDCCTPACVLETPGSACDDGSECTGFDECNGSGICVGNATPATGCFEAGKALLKIDDKAGSDRDRLKWNWLRGDAVGLVDLGEPASTTAYELCIYDMRPAGAALALSSRVVPSQAWSSKPGIFWNYSDSAAFAGGIQKIRLQIGGDGSAKVKLKGKGARLALPGPVGAQYFTKDPSVVVQLRNSEGKCWTTEFTAASASQSDLFSAKLP